MSGLEPGSPRKHCGNEVRRRQRNSKAFERRVLRALGSDRFINDGSAHSDARPDCLLAVEVTQTVKPDRAYHEKWKQAKVNAASEGRPPVLVVGEPGQRLDDADVRLRFGLFRELFRGYRLARDAGLIA